MYKVKISIHLLIPFEFFTLLPRFTIPFHIPSIADHRTTINNFLPLPIIGPTLINIFINHFLTILAIINTRLVKLRQLFIQNSIFIQAIIHKRSKFLTNFITITLTLFLCFLTFNH